MGRHQEGSFRPWVAASSLLLCLAAWIFVLRVAGYLSPGSDQDSTRTMAAYQQQNCRRVIEQAMQVAGEYCNQIGTNKVCYGNFTLQAELSPGSGARFSERGDIIDVFRLLRLSAAPLDVSRNEWGVAVFKLLANLPRSLPGEVVTLVVFGNTNLENASGDLQSFYFSSRLGAVTCEEVPLDGILVSVPEGSGIALTINGAGVTLEGDASLKAEPGGSLQVDLYSGRGSISAGGQQQEFAAGESVGVPLGGPDGNQAVGPPSAPEPLPPDAPPPDCLLSGQGCDPAEPAATASDTPPQPDPGQPDASPTGEPTFSPTSPRLPSRTATLQPSSIPTRTLVPSPTTTSTITRTPTSTRRPRPTRRPTSTRRPRYTRTPRPTRTPTRSRTPSWTRTPTPLPTETNTLPPTETNTLPPTETNIPTPTT